jgi:hypothetical protein
MKISISIATFLLAGAGVAGIGAINPIESPLQGSDTLFNVTQDALTALAALGSNIGPASTYVGGGSGNGQSALIGGTQHLAPMSRMINNGACASDTSNASGVVIGLDGVDVYGDSSQGGNTATCNSANNGFAYDGANGQGFANYKQVLALVYGGKDLTVTPNVTDCNGAKRQSVVNNWSAAFENSCNNTAGSCNRQGTGTCNAVTKICSVGGGACDPPFPCGGNVPIWHAFRRDDASGTSDVFASILGITPNTSASTLNGFGASPYCNALNWDTATPGQNNLCLLGAGKQFVGPGGVPQGFCSVTTTQACIVGATFCDINSLPERVGKRCDPAPAPNQCGGTGLCLLTNAPCPATETCVAATDGHRRPPLNTWGDDPDPNTNPRGENDADVLPTSFQDNDPIRRPCIGQTGSTLREGEEVCNRDGKLGLVLPVPASDFISSIPDPNHAGQNLVEYAVNPCTKLVLGAATKVLTCAPRSVAVHGGQCPNGDLTFGAGHTCEVPIDGINNTSQCVEPKSQALPGEQRPLALTTDNRVYNVHLHDGSTVDGLVGYVHESIPTKTATLLLDFAGAYNRIHQIATIPASGSGNTGGCTLKDSTDQIACFTHADVCSIGYAGDGGSTYQQRYASGTCTSCTPIAPATTCVVAQCSINGNPCSYLSSPTATQIGPCVVKPQSPLVAGLPVPPNPILVNKVAPSVSTVQLLGDGPLEYPLARKLYLNSLNFGFGVDTAGNPSDGGFDSGITLAELTLAKFESTVGTIGTCTGGICSVGGKACAPEGSPCASQPPTFNGIGPILVNDGFFALGPNSPTGADTPFCEDFNQALLCGTSADAGVNDNACFRNPPQWVPNDITAVPDAATFSTVCGNGVVELFEECDPAAPITDWTCSVPGATVCSSTCRC